MLNPSEVNFDRVHGTQHIYRVLLHAMSRPGVICELGEPMHNMDVPLGTSKAAASIALTLLDGEVSFGFCMNEEDGWKEHIRTMTYSKLVELSAADYVFADGEDHDDTIQDMASQFKIGTLSSPEQSATLFLKVSGLQIEPDILEEGISLKLSGPGIDGFINCYIEGLSLAWIENRIHLVEEYPLGIDLVLFTEAGRLLALPRTTVVLVEGVANLWPTLQ